jgi:hypothetical protein
VLGLVSLKGVDVLSSQLEIREVYDIFNSKNKEFEHKSAQNLVRMDTLTIQGLENALKELGLKTPIPQCPETNLLVNPLDISRSYIFDIIQSTVNCDEIVANNSIYWSNNIDNGDFTVVMPKLVENASERHTANDIIHRVSTLCL